MSFSSPQSFVFRVASRDPILSLDLFIHLISFFTGDQDDLREKRELPPALKPVADQTGKAFKCIDEQGKRAEKCLDDYKLKCGRLNM